MLRIPVFRLRGDWLDFDRFHQHSTRHAYCNSIEKRVGTRGRRLQR